jgi:uncharacterized membrane protein HdeD (DUF308 family)
MASKESVQLQNQLTGLIVAEGVFAILAGIAMLFWPGLTLVFLVVLFGIFVLVWGIVELIRSLLGMGRVKFWWLELIFSLLVIGLGVFLLRNTVISIAVVILLIGFTFIVRGIIDLLIAFFSKNEDRDIRTFLGISGVIGIIAGIIVLAQPVASGLAFVWIVGLYTIISGSVLIVRALKARS